MAIALYSATTMGGGTTAVDAGTGSTRIVVAVFQAGTDDDITGVTWNGETMNLVSNTKLQSPGTRWTYIYACYPVGTGTHNFVVSSATGYGGGCIFVYTGVNQTGSPHHGATNSGTGTALQQSITASNGDWIIGGASSDGSTISQGTNTTKRAGSSGNGDAEGDSNGVASPTALNWTANLNQAWSTNGCAISPYVQTTNIKSINGLAKASVKSVNGLAIASVKTWNGLA